MHWYELADNPQAITELYNIAPSLQAINLKEVALYGDGTRMTLKADLSQIPDKPSSDWIAIGYNTVHLQLDFWWLESIQISRWSTENQVDIQIEATPDKLISVNATSTQCSIQASAHSFRITSIKGYIRGAF